LTLHPPVPVPAIIPVVSDAPLRAAESEARELKAILDTASDGVLVLDEKGGVLAANIGAETLFGRDARIFTSGTLLDVVAPESQRAVLEYFAALKREDTAPRKGCEVIGRGREGTLLPLFMTLGKLGDNKRVCAVFRDLTSWKKTEMELVNARRQAEQASSAKSEFLAKVSHEIRTPLNSIIGFSEVMMDERFGPIANERYKQYLKDIHESGGHLVSLLNDLLDLSKIEAGKLDLSFSRVSLNELTQQCVSLMQPQANQERVIIRTSLPTLLPPVMADARSVRQIVLNLLSNSIKFTGAGGQVIVSTTQTDDGEVVLRVRDTGHGMTEKEIQMAMEPFRQLATSSRWGSGGTGLGLPLTKALAEANRANFSIKSAVNAGTLVEISFPPGRVLVA
jgi:PAS domain S-box-containing protein